MRPATQRLPGAFPCCRAPSAPRQFSTSPASRPSTASPPAPPPAGFTPLSSRRLISVSGPDSAKFLQGAITASIVDRDARPRASGFYAAFLTAHGRILFDVFIYPDTLGLGKPSPEPGTSFLVEADALHAQALARHIRRYKLRAKFDVRLLDPTEATVWHLWNDPVNGALTPGDGTSLASDPSALLTLDPRAPALGHRLLTSGDASSAPSLDLPLAPESAYHIRRYLAGVAEGQAEMIPEHALPQESNLDHMNGIEYHKGCYVGQELTIRTKHRGVVRKRILPCVVYSADDPIPETLSYDPSSSLGADVPAETKIESCNKRARNPGKWLAGVGNVGLALCRLETMTDLVGPLPTSSFKDGDEFKMEWVEEGAESRVREVKVKAFVPPWLRKALAEAGPAPTQEHAS
ncbi:folate-binding protein YgfZ [Plectosphaerella cucumerina]|uniref:Iron-sulfur cluster assembly factor IBA57 homolog, mitochondrial n=1 Tax=Plectosphaerella cucumerina TaxID=40658 RepID=A0A8K0X0W2_9PEZI|nr:folate-binding protein YgfZ [Plectosphaerella cucumerina]